MTRPPNVILLIAEHHSGDELGRVAGSAVRTPALDRVAAEGVSFGQARTPTPLCGPARASLMTGLYAHAHGMWNNGHTPSAVRPDLFSGVRLWSENLREHGYRMSYLGKWHVSASRSPEDVGWTEPARDVTVDCGEHALVESVHAPAKPGWLPTLRYGTTATPPGELSDSRLTDRVVEIIEKNPGSDHPWCVAVGYMSAHAPYLAHERYLGQYDAAELPLPAGHGDTLRDKPNLYRRLHEQNWADLDKADYAEMTRHRYAMLSYLDDQVDRILAALDRSGQAEDTLFIYTADHGDFGGAHGLFNLGVPAFDQVYRVPLLIRWPRGITQPGRSCDRFVSLLDVGPTILEAAGVPPLTGAHGRSLVPFLTGVEPTDWHEEFYGEFLGHESMYTQRQIRTREHKFVWNSFDFDELYDLAADPDETVNLREDEAYQDVRQELITRLWRRAVDTDDVIFAEYPMNGNLPIGPGVIDAAAGWPWQ